MEENLDEVDESTSKEDDLLIKFLGHAANSHDVYDKTEPRGITYFLDKIRNEEFLIPSFQREFVWTKDKVIQLLLSLFRGYPIGALLVCPTNEETRKFYKPKNFSYEDRTGKSGYIVLDGQQRLTALHRAQV